MCAPTVAVQSGMKLSHARCLCVSLSLFLSFACVQFGGTKIINRPLENRLEQQVVKVEVSLCA